MQPLVLLVALGAAFAAPAWGAPPSDYELIPGVGYYKYNVSRNTWAGARDRCKEEGTHLAVVNSQEEMDALVALWSVYPWMRNPWVGLFRESAAGPWTTVQGPVGAYTGWGPEYPTEEGNCVFLQAMTAAVYNVECDLRGQFLCEY